MPSRSSGIQRKTFQGSTREIRNFTNKKMIFECFVRFLCQIQSEGKQGNASTAENVGSRRAQPWAVLQSRLLRSAEGGVGLANDCCICLTIGRGTPMSEVPVSATALQPPSAQASRGTPPTRIALIGTCQ